MTSRNPSKKNIKTSSPKKQNSNLDQNQVTTGGRLSFVANIMAGIFTLVLLLQYIFLLLENKNILGTHLDEVIFFGSFRIIQIDAAFIFIIILLLILSEVIYYKAAKIDAPISKFRSINHSISKGILIFVTAFIALIVISLVLSSLLQ